VGRLRQIYQRSVVRSGAPGAGRKGDGKKKLTDHLRFRADFPALNCGDCQQILEEEGIEPECYAGSCRIPPLLPAGQRALEIRDRLVRLHRLKLAPVIATVYGVTKDDLDLLALIEDQLSNEKESADGQ
jgi:hypothetical protein